MMQSMRLSVVIPCYRSRGTIRELVEGLLTTLPTLASAYEVILVVDGSPDDTYVVAHQLEVEHPGLVHAVLLRRNFVLISSRPSSHRSKTPSLISSMA